MYDLLTSGSTSNIGYLMQHLSGVLAKQSEQALQERLGIGFSQFRILLVLQHWSETQQRQIADSLGQTEASISRQIKLMEDARLVSVAVSPKNRREHLIRITAKGFRLAEEAFNVLNSTHSPMFESLGDKKQEQLMAILYIMHQHTCQTGRTGACDHT